MAKERMFKKAVVLMAGEEIRQDTRTVGQIVDSMSLFDDDLMSMVFDGNIEATELLLKIILKIILIKPLQQLKINMVFNIKFIPTILGFLMFGIHKIVQVYQTVQ